MRFPIAAFPATKNECVRVSAAADADAAACLVEEGVAAGAGVMVDLLAEVGALGGGHAAASQEVHSGA